MADQQTTVEQMRGQFQMGEQMTQNMLRATTDLTLTTANLGFEIMDQGMHYAQELRGQTERMMDQTWQSYRRQYEDGLRTWQTYVQGVTEIMTRKI